MLVFIYGTLKKEEYNHWLLGEVEAEFVSECTTTDKYPLFEWKDPFPYLQDMKGKGKIVQGELWEIEDKFKSRLDYFEGIPDLYKSGKIEVKSGKVTYEDVNCYYKAEEVSIENRRLLESWSQF